MRNHHVPMCGKVSIAAFACCCARGWLLFGPAQHDSSLLGSANAAPKALLCRVINGSYMRKDPFCAYLWRTAGDKRSTFRCHGGFLILMLLQALRTYTEQIHWHICDLLFHTAPFKWAELRSEDLALTPPVRGYRGTL